MAERFLRVDLSDASRDFRPIAVEPGVPMLDTTNAHSKIFFRWLGGMAAEPVWEVESVNFFVRDDHGGRLEEIVCQPATREDLEGSLKNDLASLKERLQHARPETPTERALHQCAQRWLQELLDNPSRTDLDSYFFRYRDASGRWRLVWCWGYRRSDQESASAVICTDPNCNLLFVRRPKQSAKCPSCAAAIALLPKRPSWVKRGLLALLLLLLLLLGWLGWMYWPWQKVPPENLNVVENGTVDHPKSPEAALKSPDEKLKTEGKKTETAEAVTPDKPITPVEPTATPDTTPTTPNNPETIVVHPAVPEIIVPPEVEPPRGDRPSAVKILSDQGATVKIPAGAEFDDFRVVAEYSDGFTRLVTKKATIQPTDVSENAPVAVRNGRLVGVRPGKTLVQAEFDGVAAKEPLAVEVVADADVDVDEVRIVPSSVNMLRGEAILLDAVGYKNGKSVGSVAGMKNLTWQSSNPQAVQVAGSAIVGMDLGESSVTAQLGSVTSRPAQARVVDSISEGLTVDPKSVRIHVGETLHIGSDLIVHRGTSDVSGLCDATSSLPGVVRRVLDSNDLLGTSPGTALVTFTLGDKQATLAVRVAPDVEPTDGRIVVEPATVLLAQGQAVPLRVYVVTADGSRVERTRFAKLTSSNGNKVKLIGYFACAVAPGSVEITARLPKLKDTGKSNVTVGDMEITSIMINPSGFTEGIGAETPMRVLGTAANGIYELFPQPDLKVSVGGKSPKSIVLENSCLACKGSSHVVHAIKPGNATITASWRNKLTAEAPVEVIAGGGAWTDLRIEPAAATIKPGQGLAYRVTAIQNGRLKVLGPQQGLKLSVEKKDVAKPLGRTVVRGVHPGRTTVTAQVAGQQVEAVLDVDANSQGKGMYLVDDPDRVVIEDEWDPKFEEYLAGERTFESLPSQTPTPASVTLSIDPDHLTLKLGQTTPSYVVSVLGSDGKSHEVQAALESMNANVLAADPDAPGRFVAKGYGATQVRAVFRGHEVFASVEVTGQRFDRVISTLDEGDRDFAVKVQVTAAKSEGALEYRLRVVGQPPPDQWIAARSAGDFQEVELHSPRMSYGPRDTKYPLVIEARAASGGPVQQYPLTFQLKTRIEETK